MPYHEGKRKYTSRRNYAIWCKTIEHWSLFAPNRLCGIWDDLSLFTLIEIFVSIFYPNSMLASDLNFCLYFTENTNIVIFSISCKLLLNKLIFFTEKETAVALREIFTSEELHVFLAYKIHCWVLEYCCYYQRNICKGAYRNICSILIMSIFVQTQLI